MRGKLLTKHKEKGAHMKHIPVMTLMIFAIIFSGCLKNAGNKNQTTAPEAHSEMKVDNVSFEELISLLNIESITILDYPTDNFLVLDDKDTALLKNFPQLKVSYWQSGDSFVNEGIQGASVKNNDGVSFDELISLLNIESLSIIEGLRYNSFFIEDKNIMHLKNFPQLKTLDIRSCDNIENLDILKYLTNLERLEINATKNIDLSPIKNLENLKMLFFSTDQKLENIRPIFELENLEYLYLHNRYNEQIIDTKDISLPKLKDLSITSPQIDLTYIGMLPALNKMRIFSDSKNGILDISKLRNPELENLTIGWLSRYWSEGKVLYNFNLDWLQNLKQLKSLELYGVKNIYNIEALLKFPHLEAVGFPYTFADIMPLAKSSTIKRIVIDDVYYDNIPMEIFEKRGIELISNYTGDGK